MKFPIVVENSRIPGFLSKFANANYVAVSFAIFIFFKEFESINTLEFLEDLKAKINYYKN